MLWNYCRFCSSLLRIYSIYFCLDQRTKELSYNLRLCHLNALNSDGVPAANFGFELSENPSYDYPIISRVEPKSPGERAGLQTNDILLKINDRKTKGLDFDKVKKAIEKGKRDGRLELLVVDVATYDYSQHSKKQLKEPDIKLKHIFPKSRSSANILKVPLITPTTTSASQETSKQIHDSVLSSVNHRLSLTEEDDSKVKTSNTDHHLPFQR